MPFVLGILLVLSNHCPRSPLKRRKQKPLISNGTDFSFTVQKTRKERTLVTLSLPLGGQAPD